LPLKIRTLPRRDRATTPLLAANGGRNEIAFREARRAGAALVLVMVIVTVISLGLLGVLSLSDTSIRTTERLQEQASASYAADSAGQVAVDQIRRDTFNAAGSCTTSSGSTEVLI
jgi:Tfp pilus assembly protein PilX